jgi:hypothetical protein
MSRMRTTAACGALALAATAILAGCSTGPSAEERAEFDRFAIDRQAEYPANVPMTMPTSIKEIVLGGDGLVTADYIVAGAFTDGRLEPPPAGTDDPTAHTFIATFKLHDSLKGTVPQSFDVDLGLVHEALLAKSAAVGAGDVVLFLTIDVDTGDWVLADGGWSLALSDAGALSMPLVPRSLEVQYLTGVHEVADIAALLIAGNLDPNGTLTDDDPGMSDTEQSLIDKANEIAGNG